MSRQTKILAILFGSAFVLFVAFLLISQQVLGPVAAKGYGGPNGATVTFEGLFYLFATLIGSGGFTVAGMLAVVVKYMNPSLEDPEQRARELVELAAASANLLRDMKSKVALRRFFFALVDAAKFFPGVSSSRSNGVLVIQYDGFADELAENKSP